MQNQQLTTDSPIQQQSNDNLIDGVSLARQIMKARGLSYGQVGRSISYSAVYTWQVLNGVYTPIRRVTREKFASFFNLPVDVMFNNNFPEGKNDISK